MVVQGRIGTPPFDITFQCGACGFMQRNEPAFTELGTTNHQTIWRNIVEEELDCFRCTEACAGHEAEKRAVRIPTQRTWASKLRCCFDNAPDVVPTKNK